MRILIIGGEGYIGKVVKRYLINNKNEVYSFDNLTYRDQKENRINNKKFLFNDLLQKNKKATSAWWRATSPATRWASIF